MNKSWTETLSCFALPPAPAARAAASGPGSGHSLGCGPSPGRLLASSHVLAAPPSARLTPLVAGSALVCRKLSGQPQRGGGGTGLGAGGVAGCAALAAGEGLARTGITDSSLALFVAGSCVSLPPMMT